MIRSHRIRLIPTTAQDRYFRRACGVARFAYNWALAEWQRQYDTGERPSEARLRRQLNACKSERYPWMREVTKCAPQHAIKNLGRAYANFFEDLEAYRCGNLPRERVRRPRFKRKGSRESFRADNGVDRRHPDAVKTDGKHVKLPRVGWVRMREGVRFDGRILSVTISERAGAWYANFSIDIAYVGDDRTDNTSVGIDLGVTALAVFSDDTPKVPAPMPLRRNLRKLRRLSRALSRTGLSESCESENQARTTLSAYRRYSR